MALFPCHEGGHAYRGRANVFYVGLVQGADEAVRYKLRFCSGHAAKIYEYLAQFKVLVEDDTVSTNGSLNTCFTCGKPAGEVDSKLFITCYPPNNEREDYWSQLHVNCSMPGILSR